MSLHPGAEPGRLPGAEQPPSRWQIVGVMGVGLVAIGVSPILVRMAIATESAPSGLAVAAWRTLFAVLLLAPWTLRRVLPEVRRWSKKDAGLVAMAGVVLGLHFVGWIQSLYFTSVASASVLVTSSPIFIALLGWAVLKERVTLRVGLAIAVAVAGAGLIGLADAGDGAFPRAALGNALALTAALLVSIYLLIGRAVRQRASLWAYALPVYTGAAAVVWLCALATGTDLLGHAPAFYGWTLAMAAGPQLIGHSAFNYAVKVIPAATLGLLSLTEPIVATALAFALFGEVPAPLVFVGAAVVLGAVASVVARPSGRRPETPRPDRRRSRGALTRKRA